MLKDITKIYSLSSQTCHLWQLNLSGKDNKHSSQPPKLDPIDNIRFIITNSMLKFMKIIEIWKWKNKQMNTPSTQMNRRCILGKLIWDKTQLEGEAYTLLSFLWLWKCKYKERDTHYGVSFDTVAWMATIECSTSFVML
jgi:hypothetical protein